MGIIKRPWQDTGTIPSYFGKRPKRAIEKYEQFVEQGVIDLLNPIRVT
jgi:hypothetical protein